MKGTVPLGRYAGIPIRAHWSVLVIVGLLTVLLATDILPAAVRGATPATYWGIALGAAAVLMASLLAHELAHAALARRFGVRVRSITLWALGGMAMLEDEPPTPRTSAQVAAIGPVVSIVLSAVFFVGAITTSTSWLGGLPFVALAWLAVTNLLIGLFNLLPAAPLDGGRLLRAWLWHRYGDRDAATARAASVGQVFGYLLIGIGMAELIAWGMFTGLWLALIGWFITTSALAERQHALILGRLDGVRVRDAMTTDPVTAPGWWTPDAFVDHLTTTGIRHRVFPVVDFDGRPVGVLSLRDLAAARTAARLTDAARPLDPRTLALAGEPITDILRRTTLRPGRDAMVVLDNRELAGLLTAGDLARTVELAQLRRRPAETNDPHSADR